MEWAFCSVAFRAEHFLFLFSFTAFHWPPALGNLGGGSSVAQPKTFCDVFFDSSTCCFHPKKEFNAWMAGKSGHGLGMGLFFFVKSWHAGEQGYECQSSKHLHGVFYFWYCFLFFCFSAERGNEPILREVSNDQDITGLGKLNYLDEESNSVQFFCQTYSYIISLLTGTWGHKK